jgi:anti-sigma factor RsiW
MLSDNARRLLTARVDGELTPRQRRQVQQLLKQSPEAREFSRQLEEDVARVRALPPPALDRDLSGLVVSAIHERQLRPGRRRVGAAGPTVVHSRNVLVAAASVLLLIGMSTYLLLALPNPRPVASANSGSKTPSIAPPRALVRVEPPASRVPKTEAVLPTQPRPSPMVRTPEAVAPLLDTAKPKLAKEVETVNEETPVTAPSMELFQPERMEIIALPVVLALRDLDRDRGKLLGELRKDSVFRIELPCGNTTKAFDRVRSTLLARDVGLVIEQAALGRLRQPRWKTNYVFFTEDITPEELADLLREIGRPDQSAKPSEAVLAQLVMTRLSVAHRKELSDLLGIDPIAVVPTASGPLGTDPHKSLPELTADQVAKSLSSKPGQGSDSRSTATKTLARQALALPYNPVRPRPNSPDVRRFLDGRKPARPGTLQVLLVLRGT